MTEYRPLAIHAVPRSSTTYHAKVLRKAGFAIGHDWTDEQGAVTHWLALEGPWPATPWDMGTKKNPNPRAAHQGEALGDFRFGTQIHMVRSPLKVIGSIRGGLLSKTHWEWFAQHVPECDPGAPLLRRSILMWLRYNEAIERIEGLGPRLRVEDQGDRIWAVSMRALSPAKPGAIKMPTVSKTTNKQGGYLAAVPTTWAEIDECDASLGEQVRALAARYGYDVAG